MPQTLKRDRFTWLTYLLLAFFTYFTDILGPVMPFLKDELRLSYTVSSLHFAALAVGILIVGFTGRRVVGRLKTSTALWTGAYGMGLGALLVILSRSPWLTVPGALLTGFGGGLLLAVGPAALSERHGENAAAVLSEMGALAVMMGAAAPLLVGWSAQLGNWRWASIFALMPLALHLTLGKAAIPQVQTSIDGAASREPAISRPLPRLYWIYWGAIFLSESVEYCLIFWSPTYLQTGLGLTKSAAALGASLFLAAMIVGRFAGSRVVRGGSPRGMVTLSLLVTLVGFLIFWGASSASLGLVGLFISGLGVANLYPLCLALALEATQGDSLQGAARATLSTGSSILVLPLVLGRLADLAGLRPAFGLVILLVAAAFLMVQAAGARK